MEQQSTTPAASVSAPASEAHRVRLWAGVWPSEEILGYWLVQNQELFRCLHCPAASALMRMVRSGKSVCELGAGSGMAGIMLGLTGVPSAVHLTDGNPTVVRAIRKNIAINQGGGSSELFAEELL